MSVRDIRDINEIYEHINGKRFIVTRERRFTRGRDYEPCGRPCLAEIVEVDLEKKTFTARMYDYDEMVSFVCEYNLPEVKNFGDGRLGALQFNKVDEGKGWTLVTRFWEV